VIDLRHLEHFVAVAEERHFTRAAHRLGVVQSTISSSVSALERELGTPLFTRSTRRVEMTDAGSALLAPARRTLTAADAARAAVGAVTGLRTGKVAIGTGKALGMGIADGLARFCRAHPEISVSLQQGGSIELLEAVSEGRLDFAPLGLVGSLPEPIRDTVVVVEMHREPMVFACSQDHRLAHRKRVRLADVAGERFVDFATDWAIRIVNDQAFSELGVERRVVFEMTDVDDLLDMVRRGFGVAVIPRPSRRRQQGICLIDLRDQAPMWRVGLAVPKDRPPSPAALALLEAIVPGMMWPT
jgi:DNA-binding transcriptional LysR family regulator